MKYIITLLLLLKMLPGLSKDPSFRISGKYDRAVKKEILVDAKLIRDIIPGYATNWISEYISVELIVNNKGKLQKAEGKDEKLNINQKYLLNSADLFSHIVINVKYRNQNPATGKVDIREMHVSMTIVPEFEAEFDGGAEKMKKYLMENAIDKIDDLTVEYMLNGIVTFTIDEEGSIINSKLTKSTGDPKTDSLLLAVINKMPKWKPARDSNGVRVKQEFEFRVGNEGC